MRLKRNGLPAVEKCIGFYRKIADIRSQLPYEIDGIVFKVDDLKLQAELGFVSRAPALGHRLQVPARRGCVTEVLDIEVQVGRTGALTPVARAQSGTGGRRNSDECDTA